MDLEFNKVLVFCPHPDDAEFMCGGTLAKWASEGKEIKLCVVTNGAHGSNDPNVERRWLIETREKEQREAASITGISSVDFMGFEDGHVEDSHELRREMIRHIRSFKPEVVIGPDPSMYYFAPYYLNHPDHKRVGEAFTAAVNPGATTVPLYREELYDKGYEPHQVTVCLLGFTTHPDYFVDITDHIDTKVASIMAHLSQTPEFRPQTDNRIKDMAAAVGAISDGGYEYAEGYKYFFFEKGTIPAESEE